MSNFSWLEPGTISVIAGCMFSGKTDELIRRISVLKRAKKNVLTFKPISDKKFYGNTIISHNKNSSDAFSIENVNDVLKQIKIFEKEYNLKIDALAFDEVQFLPKDLFSYIEKWANQNIIILCAGLDKDYFDEYDSLMSKLLVRAENVEKLFAICNKCQGIANRTQRVKNGEPINCYYPQFIPGGANMYQARCNKCYVTIKQRKTN